MTPYETLGVAPDADAEAVKNAYRKQAMKHHPDRDGGDHDAMAAVQLAYDVLSDPVRRQRYDETGATSAEKTLRERAIEALGQTFNEVVDSIGDADVTDPIEACRRKMQEALHTNEMAQKQVRKKIEQRQKVLKRLRRKAEGSDVLQGALLGVILALEGQLRQIDDIIKLCDEVVLVLDDYEYEVEVRPVPSFMEADRWYSKRDLNIRF